MILELKNICKTYEQGKLEVPVLKDISLSVEEGEYVAVMGPSGSGKTTLMNLIGCLDAPTSGVYLLEGEDISQCSDKRMSEIRLKSIGFVFQSFHLLPRQSALENVALPLLYAGVRRRERLEIARRALERVGLGDRTAFKPTQLSGGQCQRVAIARAIVHNPKILLADEPTGALDTASGEQIMEIFQRLNNEGVTIVMITHEQEIADHARRVLHIRDGQLVDGVNRRPASAASHAPDLLAMLASSVRERDEIDLADTIVLDSVSEETSAAPADASDAGSDYWEAGMFDPAAAQQTEQPPRTAPASQEASEESDAGYPIDPAGGNFLFTSEAESEYAYEEPADQPLTGPIPAYEFFARLLAAKGSPEKFPDPSYLELGDPAAGIDENGNEFSGEIPAVSEAPVVEDPVIEVPVIEVPVIEVPVIEAPAIETPAIEFPVVEAPAVEAPAIEVPAVGDPVVEAPAVEAPAIEAPAVGDPVTNTTQAEEFLPEDTESFLDDEISALLDGEIVGWEEFSAQVEADLRRQEEAGRAAEEAAPEIEIDPVSSIEIEPPAETNADDAPAAEPVPAEEAPAEESVPAEAPESFDLDEVSLAIERAEAEKASLQQLSFDLLGAKDDEEGGDPS